MTTESSSPALAMNEDVYSGMQSWARTLHCDHLFAYAVTMDRRGNSYVVGEFSGSLRLGGRTYSTTPNGQSVEVFLASFSPVGEHRWSTTLGGDLHGRGHDLAVDASGRVYVTGSFIRDITIGSVRLRDPEGRADREAAFLTCFDNGGAHRWSMALHGAGDKRGLSLAVDGPGYVYLAGTFDGTLELGGTTLEASGAEDVFLASYEPTGKLRWARGFEGAFAEGPQLAASRDGRVFLAGQLQGRADLGGEPLTVSDDAVYLACYDDHGLHHWSRSVAGARAPRGLGVDPEGNVAITGEFFAEADFGGQPLQCPGAAQGFVASYTANGLHRWSSTVTSSGDCQGTALDVDGRGNVYVAGQFGPGDAVRAQTSLQCRGGPMLVSTGAHDVFMACFSSNGRHCWSRALGGARSSASVEGVVADRRGGITALGSFSGTLALDSGTVRTRGDCPHAVDTVLFSLLV